MNFSTSNAAAPQENTGSRYLSVGINDGVSITDILPGTSTGKGTPFLGVTVVKGDSKQEIPFYMSEKAAPISLRNIRHLLVDGLGVDGDKLDAIQADTLEDYAKKLDAIVPKDKTFRLKFAGEQYHKNDGSGIGTRRVIGYAPFAEPTGSNTLKFNEAKEVKAPPMPDAGAPGATLAPAKKDDNDLPF